MRGREGEREREPGRESEGERDGERGGRFPIGPHRADLLPLPVKLRLLVGLLEAPGLAALRHLDAVLEGGSAGHRMLGRCSAAPSGPLGPYSIMEGRLTWEEPLCCSYNRNIPPECRSPSVPADPSCCPGEQKDIRRVGTAR